MAHDPFDLDALAKKAAEEHKRMEQDRKDNSKWGKVQNGVPVGTTGVRLFPIPGSTGGCHEVIPFHSFPPSMNENGKWKSSPCQEYFGRACPDCVRAEKGGLKTGNRNMVIAVLKNKDASLDLSTPKFTVLPPSVVSMMVGNFTPTGDDDDDGGYEFKDFVNVAPSAMAFNVVRSGAGKDTKYEVKVRKNPIELPPEVIEKVKEYALNFKKYIAELYMDNAEQAGNAATGDDDDDADAPPAKTTKAAKKSPAKTTKKPTPSVDKAADEALDSAIGDDDDLDGGDDDATDDLDDFDLDDEDL